MRTAYTIRRSDMSVIIRSREINLPFLLDRLFNPIKTFLENNPFSFILRKISIRSKHVAEVIGYRLSMEIIILNKLNCACCFFCRLQRQSNVIFGIQKMIGGQLDIRKNFIAQFLGLNRRCSFKRFVNISFYIFIVPIILILITLNIIDNQRIDKRIFIELAVLLKKQKFFHIV